MSGKIGALSLFKNAATVVIRMPAVCDASSMKGPKCRMSPVSRCVAPYPHGYRVSIYQSYKHYRRNFKTLAEKLKLANIELTFAGYNFRHYPLAPDLGQV